MEYATADAKMAGGGRDVITHARKLVRLVMEGAPSNAWNVQTTAIGTPAMDVSAMMDTRVPTV